MGEHSPLDSLQSRFAGDMAAVNALILARMESPVPLIQQLATYLIAAGGKRVRPLMTLAATQLYGGDMARAHLLAGCVEFIHTATLLHDDVVDESLERRGRDSANAVYGNQASVLVGDFLFSRAFQLMTQDGSIEVLRILSDASATIAEGEVLQLSVAGQLDTPLDTYIQVITGKTAALFAAATEVGPVIAGAGAEQQSAMRDFGMNLGIAFQIADDLLDYTNAIGDDFREGKVTAAIFYALERASPEEQAFWHRTMQDRQQKDGDFDTALEILKSRGALVAAQDLAMRYAEEARGALDKAPDNEIKPLLHDLINFMVHRSF